MIASVRALVQASLGGQPPFLAIRRREVMERFFLLMATGEMAGLITAPARVGLRILPYVVPQIVTWKRPEDGIEAKVPCTC